MDRHEEEIEIHKYIAKIRKRLPLAIFIMLIVPTIAVAITFFLPKTYRARASVFFVQRESVSPLLASALAEGAGIAMLGMNPEKDMGIAMLRSRRMSVRLIEKMDLLNNKDFLSVDDATLDMAVKHMKKTFRISDIKSGEVEIYVVTESPALSAEIVNQSLVELDVFLSEHFVKESKFYESQMTDAQKKLQNVQGEIVEFMNKNNTLGTISEIDGKVKGLAELEQELIKKKISLDVTEKLVQNSGNPRYNAILSQDIATLKGEVEGLQQYIEKGYMGAKGLTEASLRYLDLKKDEALYSSLYNSLKINYETKKIMQAETIADFRIIDEATPPADHYSPSKSRAALIGILIGMIVAFIAICLISE